MDEKQTKPQTMAEYIAEFPEEIRAKLNEMYGIIREALPQEATEKISWGMPTFWLRGNLVHFAAAQKHVGFYPGGVGVEKFQDQLEGYKFSKGAIQFPYAKPLPRDLIQRIVRFRVEYNTEAEA